jgi:hypothetical protein
MTAFVPIQTRAPGPVPPDAPDAGAGQVSSGAWGAAARRAAFVGVLGTLLVVLFRLAGVGVPSGRDAFAVYFAQWELLPSMLVAGFGIAAAARPRGVAGSRLALRFVALTGRGPTAGAIGIGACAVFVVSVAATYGAAHATLLSMDEFNASFQARIFARGAVRVRLPDTWSAYADAITPIFVGFRTADQTWASRYLPGYALIKTPFEALGVGTLLNPVLAGAALVLVAVAARRIWPRESAPVWLAMLLLAVSTQFVLTAATGYAMPAHLTLNLLWLWLYLRDTRGAGFALGAVGPLALGLHSPFPHALFVAPFLFRDLRQRRWHRLSYLVAVYGAASAVWLTWLRTHAGSAEGGTSMAFPLVVPGVLQIVTLAESLVATATWESPVLAIGVMFALAGWRALPPVVRDLAAGVGLTFLLQGVLLFDQGHGWGYRYAHGVLGSLAIVSAAGLTLAARQIGARAVAGYTAVSLALSVAVQLPLRVAQVERETRPYAAAIRYLASIPADVVLLPIGSLWYDQDLIRNDPFLARRPVIAGLPGLTAAQVASLRARYGYRAREVTVAELRALGIRSYWPRRVPPPRTLPARGAAAAR